MNKEIEIPFGAKDSELKGWEYTIPEDMEAEIKDGKIIVREKESEDEKIRKQLIGFFSGRYALCNINTKDAIAYLERQKEQQPAEWSEEDENTLNDAITAVDMMLTDNYKESHPNLFKAFLTAKSWLKSLPERFNLQSKQEWSEEDERCFDEAIEALESLGFDGEASNLKSLRDNYKKCNCRWKPSEEQMAALLNAEGLVRANNYPENAKILASLYTDLKKL